MNMIKLTETDHIEKKTVYVNTNLVMTMHVEGEKTVLTMNNGYETKVTESIESIENRINELSVTLYKLKQNQSDVERLADAMIQSMGGPDSDETKAFIESLNENEQAFNEMAGDPLTTLDNLKVKR